MDEMQSSLESPQDSSAHSFEEAGESRAAHDPRRAALEALLFVSGSAVPVGRLAKILGASEEEVRALIADLRQEYESRSSGFRVMEIGDEVQLGTAPESAPFVEKLVKEEFPEELTSASLETLAIVLYRGPLPRSEIDFIRGVNSSYILRTLLIRGLIAREPDSRRANVWLYKPSFDLLRLLGVPSSLDLPDFETLSKKLSELLQHEKADAQLTTDPSTQLRASN